MQNGTTDDAMSIKENADGTRERIKRAARTLFAEKGFAGVTVDAIAAAAEANKAMLYYHFGSKEGLYLAVINEDLEEVSARIGAALARGRSASDKIRAFLTTYAHEVEANPELFAIVFRELVGLGDKGQWSVPRHYADAIEALAQILREGMSTREFRAIDPDVAAHALFAMLNTFFIQAAVAKCEFPLDQIVPCTIDIFFNGVVNRSSLSSSPSLPPTLEGTN